MFTHIKDLRFEAKPDGPDAAFAGRLQEILGGKWGAMTVAHQYLFQGWSCRLPGKYRDLLLDLGTEELAHVEMICTMITRLLEDAPLSVPEVTADDHPTIAAVYGATNPAHLVQSGGGPLPMDANGVPWTGSYVTTSGNLLADFHLNLTAEAQGRLQVARLFHMTGDPGVKQMLRFLLARGAMHQRIWATAIDELKADGLDDIPVPEAFPDAASESGPANTYLAFSAGGSAAEGRWATAYERDPPALGPPPVMAPGDPRLYTTPPSSNTD